MRVPWGRGNFTVMGGKLSVMGFIPFCGYFIWAMARCVWRLVIAMKPSRFSAQSALSGSTIAEKWQRAFARKNKDGLFWGILLQVHPARESTGVSADTPAETRKH
ncbi:hypothetical protein KCP69_18270 [Salmonella enterica subsp. enterica]|nr:hypothetical protein KCP69_18270 [Salmonella enterica subsp. enterica]